MRQAGQNYLAITRSFSISRKKNNNNLRNTKCMINQQAWHMKHYAAYAAVLILKANNFIFERSKELKVSLPNTRLSTCH